MGGSMRKIWFLLSLFVLALAFISSAQEQDSILIDDLNEAVFISGPEGTIDFGAGAGSTVDVAVAEDVKAPGKQSIKVTYNALPGGYIWVARGIGLDAKNAEWSLKPEDIKWQDYQAISFYMLGEDSKTMVAFDIKDKGNELWRFIVIDDFKGWKKIICPFKEFSLRSDWQPEAADKNGTLDFPLKSYQFEPLAQAKGTLYFDDIELMK